MLLCLYSQTRAVISFHYVWIQSQWLSLMISRPQLNFQLPRIFKLLVTEKNGYVVSRYRLFRKEQKHNAESKWSHHCFQYILVTDHYTFYLYIANKIVPWSQVNQCDGKPELANKDESMHRIEHVRREIWTEHK